MPVVIQEFETLPAPEGGHGQRAGGGDKPQSTVARADAAERRMAALARRQARLRG